MGGALTFEEPERAGEEGGKELREPAENTGWEQERRFQGSDRRRLTTKDRGARRMAEDSTYPPSLPSANGPPVLGAPACPCFTAGAHPRPGGGAT